MGKSSFFVRFVFCAALLALIISTIGIGSVDARDADAEPETLFRQVLSNSSVQAPVFGPVTGDLGFEAHDECSECTWAAGVNLTDVHVHFDLEWPDNPALPALLVTAVRQDDPQALDLIDPNLVTLSPDYWIHGGIAADFAQRPSSVDIIAAGNRGYFGVDGVLLTTFDLSTHSGPGDIVLSAAAIAAIDGASLGITNFSVWDLQAGDSVGGAVTSSRQAAAPIPGSSGMARSRLAGGGISKDAGQGPVRSIVSDQMTGASENSYRSPNYGFGLTWSDAWTEVDHGTEGGVDYLVLTSNGLLWADLYAVAPYVDATACNAALFDYYSTEPGYSNVAHLVDSSGNQLVVAGTDIATAWVSFSYTDAQGVTYQRYEFDVCATMPDGSTMFRLEIEGSPEDVEANLAMIEELAMGIDFGLLSNPILDQKSG